MNAEYTVDHFLAKFEAIPEELWFVGGYFDMDNPEKRCALGHCNQTPHKEDTKESIALEHLFDFAYFTVCSINDGAEPDPTWSPRPLKNILALPTPKQRVLAALRHIKELTQ